MRTGRARVSLLVTGALVATLGAVGHPPAAIGQPAPPSAPVAAGEVVEMPEAVPGEYVVILRDHRVPRAQVGEVAEDLAAEHDGAVLDTYTRTVRGFSAELSAAEAAALAADPDVLRVEENAVGHYDTTQTLTGLGVDLWGLDRIDEVDLPLDGNYDYFAEGFGVNAYILDSGLYTGHTQFGVRASEVFDAHDGILNDGDCTAPDISHGTLAAGIVGGVTVGVAKSVNLRGVTVGPCSGPTTADVLESVDWLATNAVRPAVVNASWGFTPGVTSIDDAVRASIASGITWVIAAGNDDVDACSTTPARVSQALVVGASTNTDARASFSNFGPCLDLFAPGETITSAYTTSPTSAGTASGTSFAAPFVTGVAARYLANNTTATPAQVALAILAASTHDVVTGAGTGSPNRLLFSGFLDAIPTAPVASVAPNDGFSFPIALSGSTGEVTGRNQVATNEFGEPLHASGAGNSSVWFTWTAPATGNVAFDTCTTGFDTVLAVYTGGAVNALTPVVNADQGCASGNGSKVEFLATGGTTYRVAVAGYGTAKGFFDLAWQHWRRPAVTSLSPAGGPLAGGTSVVLTGTDLTGVDAVSFGGTPATSFTVNSATQVTAVAPARAAGAVSVTATSRGGTSPAGAGSTYTYFAVPAVSSISPTSGPWAGGTSVVITGTDLAGATAVSFDGNPAASFTVDSATQITATSPSFAGPGPVHVVVTTPGGSSTTGAGDTFTVTQPAPVLTALAPASGPPDGGTTVTLAGTGFHGATDVSFGGTAAGFSVISDSQISATAPAHALGAVAVVVTGPAGPSGSRTFTYKRPANDGFGTPRVLPRGNFNVTGSNVGATKQPGEPNHGLNAGGASVWFRWVPNRSARVTLTTAGSSFDTLLGVYTGTRVNRLTLVRQNDDSVAAPPTSQVRFNAVAGRTYLIAVDGFDLGPAVTGSLRLKGTFG